VAFILVESPIVVKEEGKMAKKILHSELCEMIDVKYPIIQAGI
jgi:hypothetical protein